MTVLVARFMSLDPSDSADTESDGSILRGTSSGSGASVTRRAFHGPGSGLVAWLRWAFTRRCGWSISRVMGAQVGSGLVMRREGRGQRADGGFVLVLQAIMLPVLLGIAGMAIDLGNWYFHVQHAQRAADSAAIDGAPYLPMDPTTANAVARQSLVRNSFKGTVVNIAPVAGRPDLLGVRLRAHADSIFLQFFGIRRFDFTRASVGGMAEGMKLASPNNVLGQEPKEVSTWSVGATNMGEPEFNLHVHGSGSPKHLGARWDTNNCVADPANGRVPNFCPGNNSEYEAGGQPFTLHIDRGVTGTVTLQVYDGASAPQSNCTDARIAHVFSLYGGQPSGRLYDPSLYDACVRDSSDVKDGNGVPVGDQSETTTYTVLQANGASWTPIAGCRHVLTPLTGDQNAWAGALDPNVAHPADSPFYTFHRWATLCSFTVGAAHPAGDYRVVVEAAEGTTLRNSFSMRAGVLVGGVFSETRSVGVSLYAANRITINVHNGAREVVMPLVRLGPSAAGRTVHLESYDLADAKFPVDSLSIVPSPDSTTGGAPMSSFGCTWRPPDSTVDNDLASCTISGGIVAATYSSRVISFAIHVPNDYSCAYASKTGCWAMLNIDYGAQNEAAASIADTTSWKLVEKGRPPRLYNAEDYGF
jgi:hypothetical protein